MKKLSKKERIDLVEDLEKQLVDITQRIYEMASDGRRIIPNHPYVLVRVLPKEHRTESGLFLADTAQNKPVYEAIVVETWASYYESRTVKHQDGWTEQVVIHHQCSIKVGDRILFPHYEGISLAGHEYKYFKFVREGSDQNKFPYMNVLGTLDYQGDVEIKKEIRRLVDKLSSITTSGVSASRGANTHEVAR